MWSAFCTGQGKSECVELLDTSHGLLCCCPSQVDLPNRTNIDCGVWASEEKPPRQLDVSPAVYKLDSRVTFFCTNVYFSDLLYSSLETVSRLKFGNRARGGCGGAHYFFSSGSPSQSGSPSSAEHTEDIFLEIITLPYIVAIVLFVAFSGDSSSQLFT